MRHLIADVANSYQDLLAACHDADAIISSQIAMAAPIVAQKTAAATSIGGATANESDVCLRFSGAAADAAPERHAASVRICDRIAVDFP